MTEGQILLEGTVTQLYRPTQRSKDEHNFIV